MINLDNVVLIGPGSEWFWSAVSGLVLAITLVALYRQLRVQRGAEAVAHASRFSHDFYGEHLTRHQLVILTALDAGMDPAAVPGGSATEILNFWEEFGYLAHRGHVDVRLIWDTFGGVTMLWWIYLRPVIHRFRAEHGDPEVGEHFEWLAGRVRHLQDQANGVSPTEELARRLIPAQIERYTQRIAIFEQERTTSAGTATAHPARRPTAPRAG